MLRELSEFFNVHSGAIIVEDDEKPSSFYYFGSADKTLLNGYPSEKIIALMRHFVLYFKAKYIRAFVMISSN